jgi:hypothetical protein
MTCSSVMLVMVGPQGLVQLLLNLGQVMMSTCLDHGSLKVVDKGPLEVLLGVNGVWFKAFEPCEGYGFQDYWEVECFGRVGSARYLDGDGATIHWRGSCLPLYLGIPTGLKSLG